MNDKKIVSWSKFKEWRECPHRWKLLYIDGHYKFSGNIHTMFGTSMHTVIQTYLTTFYNETIATADALDLNEMLKEEMRKNFVQLREETGEEICSLSEMVEFYNDGVAILEDFKKKRDKHFAKRGYELLGVELKLNKDIENNVKYFAYLDVVLKDVIRNIIIIYDLKTSTRSWNKWQKADKNRTDQLLLYKQYYSELYNHPIDKIEVEFLILKRKLYENTDFPQSRLQKVIPSSGTVSMNKVLKDFNQYISECYTKEGEFNTNNQYEFKPSPTNCKYCDFRTDKELCPLGK